MRLLFLNRSFPVLTQTFVLDHIACAVDAGHEAIVAALKLLDDVDHPIIKRLGLYVTMLYSRPVDTRGLRRIARGLAKHPSRIAGRFRRSRLGWPTLTETSIALQCDGAPDMIIANFGPTGLSAVRLKKSFFPHAKVVVVFHGYDMSGYVRKLGWGNYQRMADGVDLAVCVNERWAELLRSNTAIDKIVVHHLGVDCRAIAKRPGRSESRHEILFVGRMTEKKGFDHLIEAISILASRGLDLRVHAIGDGPLVSAYRKKVRDLDLEEQFVFHGIQPHGFILEMMQEADVLVAPSTTAADGDQEGIPVVLMEAMASGIPVVSTRHSGIPELVIDGQSGLLVDEHDDAGLADSIERIVLDPELGDTLAGAANLRVLQKFNAATQNSQFFRLIEALHS